MALAPPHHWGPEEAALFFDAFHKHGQDFEKIAAAVGGGCSAAACEALHRKQQAYLSIPKMLQSAQAFAALVENAQKEEEAGAAAAAAASEQPSRSRSLGGGGGAASEAAASGAAAAGDASGVKQEDDDEEDLEEGEEEGEATDGIGGGGGMGPLLAAGRARRTPKRNFASPPPGAALRTSGRRTPLSGLKRARGPGLGAGGRMGVAGTSGAAAAAAAAAEDIYEYYDEGADAISESARKRRAARQRLDFHHAPSGAAARGRRHDADEAKGIDALLALAVAGEESLGDGLGPEEDDEKGGEVPLHAAAAAAMAPRQKQPAKSRPAPQRRQAAAAAAVEEESEEEPADAGAVDDDMEDEDFAPPPRRTPYSTPAKGRLRPGSVHVTPRRSGSRGVLPGVGAGGVGVGGLPGASPGLGALRGFSPYMLGSGLEGGDMLELGLGDLGYITSPGLMPLPPGFVPSPQNPMPRLRRRKSAPERLAAHGSVASPIKTLFTRRSSLAGAAATAAAAGTATGSLMSSFNYAAATAGGGSAGGGSGEDGGARGGTLPLQAAVAEAALRHCLQQPRTRRWAAAEFMYSALDRPFFMFNPLSGLLSQLGLGQDARLMRREWALVRSSLGKPRRLSLKFLKEERVRLERWREGCRQQYQSGAAVVADPKVADHLPRPLGVGQRVVARHPATRQLHDGSVLTVAHNCYRVQFDRQELGVERVRDTDVMPCEPAENLPPALLLGSGCTQLVLNGRQVVNGQPLRPLPPPPMRLAPLPLLPATAAAGTPLGVAQGGGAGMLPGLKPEQQAVGLAGGGMQQHALPQQAAQQQQARVADARALAELVVGLDKKEALLLQLRSMNDEAAAGLHADAATGTAAPQFVNAYANVVLQLKDVNEKVADRMQQLDRPSSGSDLLAGAAAVTGPAVPGSDSAAAVAGTAAPQQYQQLGASLVADAALQRQLQAQVAAAPASGFAEAALEEARAIMATCRRKLAESASEAAAEAAAAAAAALEAPASTAAEPASAASGREQAAPLAASPAAADGAAAEAATEAAAATAAPAAATAPSGLDWDGQEGQQLGGLIEGCVHSLVLLQQGAHSSVSLGALSAALDVALVSVRPQAAANRQLFEEIQEAMRGLKVQVGAAPF